MPGVFFPHLTISTKMLLQFLESEELAQKSFLELGCGTGIISVLAAKKEANVTASDLNPRAIDNVKLNAKNNSVELKPILSDLFKSISPQAFDYIIINPPYYPKNPKNQSEIAWFCGENFEYFESLFSTISPYLDSTSKVYMILSIDCDLVTVKKISTQNNLIMTLIKSQKKWGELNYIFQIKK